MSILAQDTIVISPKTVNEIKQEIEDLKGATDCADVVGTKAELDAYDTSSLTDQAIIKVLQDESQDNAQTYYRYSTSSDSFTLIGKLGPFYTKDESDQIMANEVEARTQADQDLDEAKQNRPSSATQNNIAIFNSTKDTIDSGKAFTTSIAEAASAVDTKIPTELAIRTQLDTKVDKNDAITSGTHTKITYDSKGLVTGGADLQASDIPNLSLSKITDVTASASEVNVLDGITASTSELNILDGATLTTTELNYVDGVTSSIQSQLDDKVAKVNKNSVVYIVDSTGAQSSLSYTASNTANTLVARDTNSQINVNLTPTADNHSTSKKYVDDKVTAAITEAVVFKGIVASETALPSSGNVNGDMYWITAFSSNPPTGMHEGRSGSAIYHVVSGQGAFEYTEDAIYQPDAQTIDLNGNGKLSVLISATAGNTITSNNDGLYVPTVDQSGKVDKVSSASKVYGTDSSSNQTTYDISTNATANTIAYRAGSGTLTVGTPTSNYHATTKKYVDDADGGKVDKTTTASQVYGTDANGAQTTYDKNSFGQVDDVKVDNVSVVTNKIASIDLSGKQNKPTITTSTSTTLSVTLTDNTIFNNTNAGLTTLTITNPTTPTVDFASQINFTSGSTATVVNASDIVWMGDNVSEIAGFVPRTNCRYTIDFVYDGSNIRGYIQGVSL